MAVFRTDGFIRSQEADKGRQQHVMAMQKARSAATQAARQHRSNAGMGAVKLGLGLARRFIK